jgi:N-acetyl-gamma-glutamyl-phosphate reductase/acetylglutamate kinase
MDLRHVSSRELAGQELKGYDKRKIIYENLSPEDAVELDKSGKVDGWVLALPNVVAKPFVDAFDNANSKSVIVDLSADYRFDDSWTRFARVLGSQTLAVMRRAPSSPWPPCLNT